VGLAPHSFAGEIISSRCSKIAKSGQWQEAAARAKGAKVIVHQQRQGLLEGCGIFDHETWLSLAGHWAIFSHG